MLPPPKNFEKEENKASDPDAKASLMQESSLLSPHRTDAESEVNKKIFDPKMSVPKSDDQDLSMVASQLNGIIHGEDSVNI